MDQDQTDRIIEDNTSQQCQPEHNALVTCDIKLFQPLLTSV